MTALKQLNMDFSYPWCPDLHLAVTISETTRRKINLRLFNDVISTPDITLLRVDASWNVMAHAQKPDFVFRRNWRVHLNLRGRQISRLLAADLCASAVVMLDIPCSEVVWRVLATHSIRHFPLHFPSRASPCAITFQLDSKTSVNTNWNVTPIHRKFHSFQSFTVYKPKCMGMAGATSRWCGWWYRRL